MLFRGSVGPWYVVVASSNWRRGHGVASARGSNLQQVVGVPVSLSCDSGGGQKGLAVGGGSIHKLPPALPGRKVVLSPLRARRSTAATVALGTY